MDAYQAAESVWNSLTEDQRYRLFIGLYIFSNACHPVQTMTICFSALED